MKILYLSSSFPRKEQGENIYTDLACEFHEEGNDITVCLSDQNAKQRIEYSVSRGFYEYRIKIPKYYNVNIIRKGISFIFLPLLMICAIKKILLHQHFDLILYESPPVSNYYIIKWLARRYKSKTYLMQKDIFPQNAVDLGIIKKSSILYRYFRRLETNLYKISDFIGCMSSSNIEYIQKNCDIPSSKTVYFPNTKKVSSLSVKNNQCAIRTKHKLPINSIQFIFGGNMGKPQYIKLHVDTIIHFMNDSRFSFVFIGRGTDKHHLVNTIEKFQIYNAFVFDELHRDDYEEILSVSDVGVISLDPRFTIPNFPSRVLSYMEYAKPILAATDPFCDVRKMILEANNGFWVDSSNTEEYFKCINEIATNTSLKQLGRNGREYLLKHFDVNTSVKLINQQVFGVDKNV